MWSSREDAGVPEFKTGDTLCGGRFVIESYEGCGGVGAAYRAHDIELKRTIVCKIAHEDADLAWAETRGQFDKLAKITSRDVVRALGFFVHEYEQKRRPVLALEWIDGHDLQDWMRAASLHERFKAVARIAAALADLHAAGLMHGDFQRGINVRVTNDDRIVLIDPDSEITGSSPLAWDRKSLAGIIRDQLAEFVSTSSTSLRAAVQGLEGPAAQVSTHDISLQIASAARSVPLISLDAPLLVAAQAAYKEERARRQGKYEHIRRQRAQTFDRLAAQIRALATGFGLDARYEPDDASDDAMKDAVDGQLSTRQITVFAALSSARWVVTLLDARGFRKPWPFADGSLIARGHAFIDGAYERDRADVLELRMVDDVPVVYVATDAAHPATHARLGTLSPVPTAADWSDQTDHWILESFGDLLGLALSP